MWFRYRAPQDGLITANTFGSDYDTTLSVYTSTPGRMVTQIACNDDYDNLQSSVLFEARAGVTYYVMAGAYASGPGGHLRFSIEVAAGQAAPAVQISITSVSLDSASGRLTLEGTATCAGPTSGSIFGDVTQKRADGEIRAFFGVDAVCGGSGTWRAVSGLPRIVRSGTSSARAVFHRGTAVGSARGWMWNETTGEISESQTFSRIRLY